MRIAYIESSLNQARARSRAREAAAGLGSSSDSQGLAASGDRLAAPCGEVAAHSLAYSNTPITTLVFDVPPCNDDNDEDAAEIEDGSVMFQLDEVSARRGGVSARGTSGLAAYGRMHSLEEEASDLQNQRGTLFLDMESYAQQQQQAGRRQQRLCAGSGNSQHQRLLAAARANHDSVATCAYDDAFDSSDSSDDDEPVVPESCWSKQARRRHVSEPRRLWTIPSVVASN